MSSVYNKTKRTGLAFDIFNDRIIPNKIEISNWKPVFCACENTGEYYFICKTHL